MASVMRVSDLDRELAARRLCDAASVGVLSVSELEWRLDRVLSAATHGQLEAVLLDLPAPRSVRGSPVRAWLRAHLGAFVIVNSGLAAIWAAAGFRIPLAGVAADRVGHADLRSRVGRAPLPGRRESLTPAGPDAGARVPGMKDDKRPSTLPRAPGEVAEWLKALAC